MDNYKYDCENICRTCLSTDSNLKPIFEVQISNVHTIRMVDFVRRMTSLKMMRDDGLPENLCIFCIDKIFKAYNFTEQCISADAYLRKQLQYHPKQTQNNQAEETDERQNYVTESQARLAECVENYENDKLSLNEIILDQHLAIEDDYYEENIDTQTTTDSDLSTLNHTDRNKYGCSSCKKIFDTKLSLKSHELKHQLRKPYSCSKCLKTFTKKSTLSVHMRSHRKAQDKTHICQICGQKFGYLYLLKQHTFKHTDEKPFPCTKCKKGCSTAESLRRHMRVHEENYEKKQHICSVCSKAFPYPSFLAEHMKTHTGEKPFLCSTCGKGFRQSGALQYHIRSHTGFKPYQCQICNNSFTSRGVLRVHMRRHTDERPYVCDICGMAFRQSTDMMSHRRIHTGDKRALCTVCGKRMSTTGQLTIHIRTHTGEKPFGCDFCQKAFTTRTMLVKHRRIHTGERPYNCTICGLSFNQSSTLKTHGLVHKKQVLKIAADKMNNTKTENMQIFDAINDSNINNFDINNLKGNT